MLDSIDLQVAHNGGYRCQNPQHENRDKSNLLARPNLKLQEHRKRKKCRDDIRNYCDDGIASEGRTWGQACALDPRIPALVYLENSQLKPGFLLVCEDKRKRTSQMRQKDEAYGDPNDDPIDLVMSPLDQA
ncbi:unnamed protein product [Clonostachys rosea f. rosea IK726]|uniref:Uncharacterized protein n=1 Tax=Clonostachys rosea f. rosea IK726 TaxID=1349383 RepID=A0ACA9U2H9_BIOOC|nr:unnamed protein product [Clonostachys rosea f. rosea IK726]